jgi:hypothetical protein
MLGSYVPPTRNFSYEKICLVRFEARFNIFHRHLVFVHVALYNPFSYLNLCGELTPFEEDKIDGIDEEYHDGIECHKKPGIVGSL